MDDNTQQYESAQINPRVNAKQTVYIQKLFDYTNELFRRTENRANYLFVGNSIVAAAFFSIVGLLLDHSPNASLAQNDWLTSASIIAPAIVIGVSVLSATWAILPIILDAEIKLNQSFIAAMSNNAYHSFLLGRDADELELDFVDEIHILSRILEVKNHRLKVAMMLFITSFLSIFIGAAVLSTRVFFELQEVV